MSTSISSGGSGSSSSYEESSLRTNQVEREANQKIMQASKRVEEANREAENSISHIKDQFERQSVAENSRQQAHIDAEQSKGYQKVRDAQNTHQKELRKTKRDGDRELEHLREFFRDTLHNTAMKNSDAIRDNELQSHHQIEAERTAGNFELAEVREQNSTQLRNTQQSNEAQLQKLMTENQKQFEKMRLEADETRERVHDGLEQKVEHSKKEQAQVLEQIRARAGQQIIEIRRDTADKLAAYRSRQSDPFYKLYTLDAKLHEEDGEYILTASIPEYEQQHVSASVKGNNLVISGNRRNEETLTLEPGHQSGTASYQSFHESFPLTWPVESKLLTKEFHGDTVIVRVPKKNEWVYQTPVKEKPEKVRAEPPRFPDNIRKPHYDRAKEEDGSPPVAAQPKLGSDTIS